QERKEKEREDWWTHIKSLGYPLHSGHNAPWWYYYPLLSLRAATIFVKVFRITLSVSEGTGSGKTVPSLTLRVIRRHGIIYGPRLRLAAMNYAKISLPR